MRPLRLTIGGFTCYRESQQIDLSHLRLFAISGATGAGKSSLLDAMVFALYGCVPRLGDRNLEELITLGLNRASVLLDFEVLGRRYRIARTMRRKGAKKAQLEEQDEEGWKPVVEGVRETDERVQALLGLSYDAFVQSVMLPQGKFAEFLQSEPKKRRDILTQLLRLDVYERMRKRAAELQKERETAIAGDLRLLEEHYVGATPERRAALQLRLRELQATLATARKELETARESQEELNRRWAAQRRLSERRLEQAQLEASAGEVEAGRRQLEADGRARQAAPLLDEDERQRARLVEARRNLAAAEQDVAPAEEAWAASKKRLDRAETEARRLPELRRRLEQLRLAARLAPERDAAAERERRSRHAAQQAFRQAEAHRGEASEQNRRAARLAGELEENLRQQEKVGYHPRRHERLQAQRSALADLGFQLERLRERRRSAETARKRFAAAGREAEEKRNALLELERRFAPAAAAAEAAQQVLAQVQGLHAAHLLRAELQTGEPCPVCSQSVAMPPPVEAPPDLADAEGRLAAAEAAASPLEQDVQEQRQRVQIAEAAATAAQDEAQRNAEDAEQAAAAVAALETALRQEFRDLLPLDRPLPRAALEALDESERRAGLLRDLQADQNRIEVDRREAEAFGRQASTQLESSLEQERLHREAAADAERERRRLEAELSSVGAADPVAEKAKVEVHIEDIEAEAHAARRAERSAADAYASGCRKLEVAASAAQAAEEAAREASRRASEGARRTGFDDVSAVRSALLPDGARRELAERVRQFDERRAELHSLIAEVERKVGPQPLSEAELEEACRRFEEKQAELEALNARSGELAQELGRLERDLAKAEELRGRLAAGGREAALCKELAIELQSNRFQDYVLESAFRRLLAGASQRLMELSERRYEVDLGERGFVVIDHEHGQERRSANTLSGGETFLASLALALELSEQIQGAAGAVRLDSLFIDEGFGTLDPETLDAVIQALHLLNDGSRMIGVITHVASLTSQLPARLEVTSQPDGATVRAVRN